MRHYFFYTLKYNLTCKKIYSVCIFVYQSNTVPDGSLEGGHHTFSEERDVQPCTHVDQHEGQDPAPHD